MVLSGRHLCLSLVSNSAVKGLNLQPSTAGCSLLKLYNGIFNNVIHVVHIGNTYDIILHSHHIALYGLVSFPDNSLGTRLYMDMLTNATCRLHLSPEKGPNKWSKNVVYFGSHQRMHHLHISVGPERHIHTAALEAP